MSLIEEDTCIICLESVEEAIGELVANDRCKCKYIYHPTCMKNIVKCPLCNKSYLREVTLQHIGMSREADTTENRREETCFLRFILFTVIIAGISVIGYFSAVYS